MPGEISRQYAGPPDGRVPTWMCDHDERDRRQGPRVPLVHGSGPTEICTICDAWRVVLHKPGPWRNPPIAAADGEASA